MKGVLYGSSTRRSHVSAQLLALMLAVLTEVSASAETVFNVQAASPTAPHVSPQLADYRSSLSEVPSEKLAAYFRANDGQRLPFESALATIRACLRQPEDTIQPCLDAGSSTQACETDWAQCGTAAEQAWQLYIAYYLDLLGSALPTTKPAASQTAWAAYVAAECALETAPYPSDVPMRHNVDTSCRLQKAEERALELRAILINARG